MTAEIETSRVQRLDGDEKLKMAAVNGRVLAALGQFARTLWRAKSCTQIDIISQRLQAPMVRTSASAAHLLRLRHPQPIDRTCSTCSRISGTSFAG
jgi:hypothetical protein